MGRHQAPDADRRPANDALDLVYVDQGTEAVVYDLAILLMRGIRGTVMLRCEANGDVRASIHGTALWYLHRQVY